MKLYMVEIRVRDWPHTFHWYRDVLGLPVIFVDEPNRFVMLSAGRVRLALKAGSPTDPVHESVNLVFEVSDVVRSSVPHMTLDEAFEKKDDVSESVRRQQRRLEN